MSVALQKYNSRGLQRHKIAILIKSIFKSKILL